MAGYSLTDTAVTPNTPINLTLIWQALTETDINYRVFVHLLDDNNNLIAQSDAIPDNWTRPTTGWVEREYIIDRHTLTIPNNAPLGDYTVIVGWYDPTTGTRLGETELNNITIQSD